MPREDAATKGRRYLTEGRVQIERVAPMTRFAIVGKVRGDSGDVYTCGYDADDKQWRCTCPARGDSCAHLVAVKLVCLIPPPPQLVPRPAGGTPQDWGGEAA